MKNTILAKFAACLVCASAITTATSLAEEKKQDGRSRGAPRAHTKEAFLQSNDANGDGEVTHDEFRAARASSHSDKDLNGDGIVTEAEYIAEWEKRLDEMLATQRESSIRQAHVRYGVLDKDEDNNITLSEFNASGERTFTHYDTDGDGVVTEAESAPENRFGDVEQAVSEKEDKKAKKKAKKRKTASY